MDEMDYQPIWGLAPIFIKECKLIKKLRIIVIAGIRSQYIKLCAFQRILKKLDKEIQDHFEFIYIDSGQHYDHELSGGYIKDLNIKFDYRLEYSSKVPTDILGDMIKELCILFAEINSQCKVDYVVVFGDANTTLAGAIAASKSQIKIIHIEAGLRIGNLSNPEEGNRIVADHLASIRFVSNKSDMNNLVNEGISKNSYFSGDIIYDLVLDIGEEFCNEIYVQQNGKDFKYINTDFVIASMHRHENLDQGVLFTLFRVLGKLKHDILFIAHPRVTQYLKEIEYDNSKITVVNHIPYKDMISALSKCRYIITDSGAIQRESFYLGKRCLIRQDRAFWQSLVDIGVHRLIGKHYDEMMQGIEWIELNTNGTSLYPQFDDLGTGHAVEYIMKKLIEL